MTKERADQIITISLFVLLASTVGGELRKAKGHNEKYYGQAITAGFLYMFVCSIIAEIAPQVGALLAVSGSGWAFFHYALLELEGSKGKQPNLNNPQERFPGKGQAPGPLREPQPLPEEALNLTSEAFSA